jgi:hypothetical protein
MVICSLRQAQATDVIVMEFSRSTQPTFIPQFTDIVEVLTLLYRFVTQTTDTNINITRNVF